MRKLDCHEVIDHEWQYRPRSMRECWCRGRLFSIPEENWQVVAWWVNAKIEHPFRISSTITHIALAPIPTLSIVTNTGQGLIYAGGLGNGNGLSALRRKFGTGWLLDSRRNICVPPRLADQERPKRGSAPSTCPSSGCSIHPGLFSTDAIGACGRSTPPCSSIPTEFGADVVTPPVDWEGNLPRVPARMLCRWSIPLWGGKGAVGIPAHEHDCRMTNQIWP